jgi:hypothetical protein
MSNKMQRYTVYFIWKLLYMFWGGTITHHQECTPTASGICHTITATCHYRGRVHSTLKPVPTLPRQQQVEVTV